VKKQITPTTEGNDMKVTLLPDASREEMLKAAGLEVTARTPGVARTDEGHRSVSGLEDEENDFLSAGGWHVVDIKNNEDERGGLTTFRGVLHPDDYVDTDTLQALVERNLNFTYAEISAAYDITGRPTVDQTEKRRQIDAALLGLSRSGGNMLELAKAFGWVIEPATGERGEKCKKMERAVARAEKAEA
jgi:hypothetical protein